MPLLETHDPGQEPQKGGLVYAKYGKGVYIYNAYAFYRQLPEGVPGAYRLFANMISLAKNPQRTGAPSETVTPRRKRLLPEFHFHGGGRVTHTIISGWSGCLFLDRE